MNKKQKVALWVGIAAAVIMGLYPPWNYDHPKLGSKSIGYSSIFTPAQKQVTEYNDTYTETANAIDATRLIIEWVLVAIVTGGLIVTLSGGKE